MNMTSSAAFQIIYCMESSTDVINAAQNVRNSGCVSMCAYQGTMGVLFTLILCF